MFRSANKSKQRFGLGIENLERRELFSAGPLAEWIDTAPTPALPGCETAEVDSFFDVFVEVESSGKQNNIGSSGMDGVTDSTDQTPLTYSPDTDFAYGTLRWSPNGASDLQMGAGPGQVVGPHVRGWDDSGAFPLLMQAQIQNHVCKGTYQFYAPAAAGEEMVEHVDQFAGTAVGNPGNFKDHTRIQRFGGQDLGG